tara:strand:- start:59 stop:244 length:186 start_codon:yes stop_codon:yes gene_type:complete
MHSTDTQCDKAFITQNAAYWIEIDRLKQPREITDEELEDALGYGTKTVIRILSEARNKSGI